MYFEAYCTGLCACIKQNTQVFLECSHLCWQRVIQLAHFSCHKKWGLPYGSIRTYTNVTSQRIAAVNFLFSPFLLQKIAMKKQPKHITCTTTLVMLSPHTIATATTLLTCQDSSTEGPTSSSVTRGRDRAGTPDRPNASRAVRCHGEKNNTHKRCVHHVCCVSNRLWNYKQK